MPGFLVTVLFVCKYIGYYFSGGGGVLLSSFCSRHVTIALIQQVQSPAAGDQCRTMLENFLRNPNSKQD